MRHNKKFNHLGRTSAHRKSMLGNMAVSLIMHKRITTTVAKAKALRVYVEPLITKSKEDTTHQRRMVFRKLQDKFAVTELFREVSVKVADRPGGYTRIIKLGQRLGDNADMCLIELVDFNENLLGVDKKAPAKAKSTRRRGVKKAASPAAETKPTAGAKAQDKVVAEKSEAVADAPEAVVEADEVEAVAEIVETVEVEKPTEEVKVENEAEVKTEVKAEAETPVVEDTADEPEAKADEDDTKDK